MEEPRGGCKPYRPSKPTRLDANQGLWEVPATTYWRTAGKGQAEAPVAVRPSGSIFLSPSSPPLG